jgi:uncharacterized protein with von Willebrand factor type A (vWA) domain
LTRIDLGDREEVRLALVAAFKIEPQHAALFDRLFAAWWSDEPAAERRRARLESDARGLRGKAGAAGSSVRSIEPTPELSGDGQISYSAEAILRKRAFEECTDGDLRAMERLMARWARLLASRLSRRVVPSRRRGPPDRRHSFRRAVAQGGEFRDLAHRERARERPRLVVLCDTSGSMDPHARFLLSLILALRRAAQSCEIFAFNTSLVRLTTLLRPGRVEATLQRLQAEIPGWSSGTRIGECLAEFRDRHLTRLVDSATTVIIISDGLDQGDLAPLGESMRALRRRARAVLWLNPLAGDPRYEPTARAMAAALPYVDRLLPAHDLDSLSRLLPLLSA